MGRGLLDDLQDSRARAPGDLRDLSVFETAYRLWDMGRDMGRIWAEAKACGACTCGALLRGQGALRGRGATLKPPLAPHGSDPGV